MDLSPQQIDFLKKHCGYDGAGWLKKRSMSNELQEFWRRREKAQEALRVLPPDHPQRAGFEKIIDDATKKAEGANLKGAYQDLKQVKIDARRAADTVKRGVTAGLVRDDIQPLKVQSGRLQNFHEGVYGRFRDRAQEIRDALGDLDKVADAGTPEEAFRQSVFLREHIAAARLDLAGLEASARNDINLWTKMLAERTDWQAVLKRAGHNLTLLQKEKPKEFDASLQVDMVTIAQRMRDLAFSGGGKELKADLEKKLRELKLEIDAKIKEVSKFDKIGGDTAQSTKNDGTPMSPEETRQAREDMAERFRIAEEAEQKRLERAREAYLQAIEQDRILNATKNSRPDRKVELETFDTAEFFGELMDDMQKGHQGLDQLVQKGRAKLGAEIDKLVQANPDSDVLFDLASRSNEEWKAEVAKSLGVPNDEKAQSELEKALIKGLSAELARTARDKFPNKTAKDMSSVTVGGITYSDIKFLGQGGGGTVYKCTDPATGQVIVLKTPSGYKPADGIDEKERQDLAKEARNHRMATGGEDHDCHDNVLDMKGLVMGPNGEPFIAMDLADAGDADKFTQNVGAAQKTGLISEQARQAMVKNSMRQMVRGMKSMQDKNMTHHDLKEANVFLMADGTFKVADFGLGRQLDSRDSVVEGLNESTPGYEAPEIYGLGEVTQKSDNFTLGVMLDKMMDPLDRKGEKQESFGYLKPQRGQTTDNKDDPVTATSMDRLRNAMLEPDPNKRPTLDAILFSSFFSDTDENYTDEDVKELMAASAAYSGAVGGRVGDLNFDLNKAEATIKRLELDKVGRGVQQDIDLYEREILRQDNERKHFEKIRDTTTDSEKKANAIEQIASRNDTKKKIEERLQKAKSELGKPLTNDEIQKIDKRIEAERNKIAEIEKKIEAIHKEPKIAPFVMRLKIANKPFEARG